MKRRTGRRTIADQEVVPDFYLPRDDVVLGDDSSRKTSAVWLIASLYVVKSWSVIYYLNIKIERVTGLETLLEGLCS
jgi:hypothetical protein